MLVHSLTAPAASDFGAWIICALALVMGLDRLLSLFTWFKGYVAPPGATPTPPAPPTKDADTDKDVQHALGQIHVTIAKLEAKISNGMASDIGWLRKQTDANSQALGEVKEEQARQRGILEMLSRSQRSLESR